jgi:hypothetical protein
MHSVSGVGKHYFRPYAYRHNMKVLYCKALAVDKSLCIHIPPLHSQQTHNQVLLSRENILQCTGSCCMPFLVELSGDCECSKDW